jgi:hypothetical protein
VIDPRIETWERMFDVAETGEEIKQLFEMAETSGELPYARAGFCRATYPKGERP